MGKEQNRFVLCASSSMAFLLLLAWLYASVFSSDVTPFEAWKLPGFGSSLSSKMSDHEAILANYSLDFPLRRLVRGDDRIQLDTTGFACHSDLYSELCIANKEVRIDNKNLTVYIPSSQSQISRKNIKPYPTTNPLHLVTSMQIVNEETNLPACDFNHNVPVLVFSSGGYTGNLFHEMDELIIPLFITSRHFRSNLKFVITDYKAWWVNKYSRILSRLSRYEFINPAVNGSVHCFPGAVIGLKFHGLLALNRTDIPGGYSMFDFKHFLAQTYNLKHRNVFEIKREKPVLILISRAKTRRFVNEDEMVVMMEELGFEVVVTRPNRMSNLNKFSELLNSCSVLVGAHGAGMTNEVFLPVGAVAVQVVPLGLDWASTNYFGEPAREMGVKYLEYKIEPEESTLFQTYGKDHVVVTDPQSIFAKGYQAGRAVYIDEQNLKINVERFRGTLVQAKQLIED
ncbi:alpha-1,3-arabinosyltransferase XAT3-like [Pistacia vera]|uniref:alpha-1,3-arabinosyltransferase XAT3-like n=1 Tax=Pistacia vera TaxID=55513 RepID=UPI0012634F9A|nr:alpha-1,3-arabinosyltransferase XAT3-like [Pistacia vera]